MRNNRDQNTVPEAIADATRAAQALIVGAGFLSLT